MEGLGQKWVVLGQKMRVLGGNGDLGVEWGVGGKKKGDLGAKMGDLGVEWEVWGKNGWLRGGMGALGQKLAILGHQMRVWWQKWMILG